MKHAENLTLALPHEAVLHRVEQHEFAIGKDLCEDLDEVVYHTKRYGYPSQTKKLRALTFASLMKIDELYRVKVRAILAHIVPEMMNSMIIFVLLNVFTCLKLILPLI